MQGGAAATSVLLHGHYTPVTAGDSAAAEGVLPLVVVQLRGMSHGSQLTAPILYQCV